MAIRYQDLADNNIYFMLGTKMTRGKFIRILSFIENKTRY